MKIVKSIVRSTIALWKKTSENPKAPLFSGNITLSRQDIVSLYNGIGDAGAVQISVALWATQSENDKAPAFSGTVSLESKVAAIKATPKVEPKKISRKPKASTNEISPEMKAALLKFAATLV